MATLSDIANKLNNSKVTKINDISVGVDSMGTNWIRYDNGIQVVWGSFSNITVGTFITFPMPFSKSGYGIVCDKCFADNWSLNGFKASSVESVYVSYNCVGYWK